MPGETTGSLIANTSLGCVAHAAGVLGVLGRNPEGLGVSEIARGCGLAKSGAHRILSQLEVVGFVERLAGGRYRFGLAIWQLGQVGASVERVRAVARPLMLELTAESGETAHLAVLDRNAVVYLAKVETPSSVRAYAEIGDRAPAHAVATGKALLAVLDPRERDLVLGTGALPRFTSTTVPDRAALDRQLAEVAQCGYALNVGEWRAEVNGVAVAASAFGRQVALGIAGPAYRFGEERARGLAGLLQRQARELAQRGLAPLASVG